MVFKIPAENTQIASSTDVCKNFKACASILFSLWNNDVNNMTIR